jgi:plasmid stability protein
VLIVWVVDGLEFMPKLHETCRNTMPSLQIRDLPEPLHRLLQHRAQAHKRSLSQQALADLEAAAGGDPRQRRLQVLQRIAQREPLQLDLSGEESPEALIHADRDR